MSNIRKYLYWATIGLFIYMPFHILLSQWLSTFTGGLDAWKIAKDVFTALLVSMLVCAVLILKKYTRPYLVFVSFAVIYLILHITSWLLTNQPNDTGLLATVYNNRIVWYVLIGYSVALLFPDKDTRKVFAKLLIAVSAIVCLIGLAQWLLPKDIMTHFGYSLDRGVKPNFFIDEKPDFPRVMSTIRDPNSLGAFLLLPSTLLTVALLRFWNTQKRMLLGGLLLLHGLAILLTFSRSAWLGFIIVESLALAYVFRKQIAYYFKKLLVPIILLIIVLGGLAFVAKDTYFFQNVILHADESTEMADPNELRVMLGKRGIEGIKEDPEGHGPGTAGLVSTRLPDGLLTENYFLQIAFEIGVIGFLLFMAFLGYLARLLWLRREDMVVQALLISLIGLCFVNLLAHIWANEAVASSWFMLAGLALGAPVATNRAIKK